MVLMPFLFFLAVTIAYPLRQNLSSYLAAKSLESKVEVIQLTLSVVNETQKERGFLGQEAFKCHAEAVERILILPSRTEDICEALSSDHAEQ